MENNNFGEGNFLLNEWMRGGKVSDFKDSDSDSYGTLLFGYSPFIIRRFIV